MSSNKRVGEPAPPELLTKKWLCTRLGISLRCGHRGALLRSKVFTDDVLAQIGISPDEYRQRRTFSRTETIRIIQVLQL